MMRPRLEPSAIVETATLLSPYEVAVSDPRLARTDLVTAMGMALMTPLLAEPNLPLTYFVEWPDLSLGIADLWADEPRRSIGLLEAYALARQALEVLALESLPLNGATLPQ